MKSQKGITLIALIITIVVMLILVAVSITVALQSGLFTAAGNAGKQTQDAYANDVNLSSGEVSIGGQPRNLADPAFGASYVQ